MASKDCCEKDCCDTTDHCDETGPFPETPMTLDPSVWLKALERNAQRDKTDLRLEAMTFAVKLHRYGCFPDESDVNTIINTASVIHKFLAADQ